MVEKTISKHLVHLEKQFAANHVVLQQASKLYHELDQIEFELGLIDQDDTTARKCSWWPIISLISDESAAKTTFLNQFLGSVSHAANVHTASHKFTVFQNSQQSNLATLPGTALDVDHRLPFYRISEKIEKFKAGEGAKINSYLELKTLSSIRLKNRLFIETPDFNTIDENPVRRLLTQEVIETSDLVLIFTSVFENETAAKAQLVANILTHQDANKFVYIIDHSGITLTPERAQASLVSWRKRLGEMGLNTGQFVILANTLGLLQNKALMEIDERLTNLDNDRCYRILHKLDQGIRDVYDVDVPEVSDALANWKERCYFSTLIVIGLIVSVLLFFEITMGILDVLFDPVIGSIALVVLIAIITPLHVLMSKMHAKSFIKKLYARQKELSLTENLAGLFEKNITFWRIIFPVSDAVGANKKYRTRLRLLSERVKDLVQSLNDQFSGTQSTEGDSSPTRLFNLEE